MSFGYLGIALDAMREGLQVIDSAYMNKVLLLVEDNPTDEKLTLRAFKKSGVANEVIVVRDGAEALDDLGANAHVRKPVDFGEFAETARTLGLFWLLLNEPPPARTGGA